MKIEVKIMEPKIVYYSDILNDEFSDAKIKTKKIDENYKYIRKGPFRFLTHIFWYRMVACVIGSWYMRIKFRHKIINKKILKPYKKDAYFIYGNHTQDIADALIPTMVNGYKDTYVIVHPNNVSMPYLGKVTPSMGAIPLPDDIKASKNFIKCIDYRVKGRHVIMIYPEAHIWPYCTFIRPFKDLSFRYPVEYDKPAFCFVNVYKKRKNGKIKIETHVAGPFFADKSLSNKDARLKLRNEIYEEMDKLSKLNEVEVIKYVAKEKAND
jgi:hypothetical protein